MEDYQVVKSGKFNTRRLYAANGQEIVWCVIQCNSPYDSKVLFSDRARGIDGAIDLCFGNFDLVTNDWVLRAYDDHHYRSSYRWSALLREECKARGY